MGSRRRKIRPRCRRADPPLHAPHSPLTGWENKSSRDDLDHHRAAIGPRDRPIIGGGSSEFPLSRSHRHGIAHGALSTIETGDRTAIASQSWKPDPARLASSSRSFFLSRFPSVRSSSCLVIVLSFFFPRKRRDISNSDLHVVRVHGFELAREHVESHHLPTATIPWSGEIRGFSRNVVTRIDRCRVIVVSSIDLPSPSSARRDSIQSLVSSFDKIDSSLSLCGNEEAHGRRIGA